MTCSAETFNFSIFFNLLPIGLDGGHGVLLREVVLEEGVRLREADVAFGVVAIVAGPAPVYKKRKRTERIKLVNKITYIELVNLFIVRKNDQR